MPTVRRKCPLGHLIRADGRTKCDTCSNVTWHYRRYHRLRSLGFNSSFARGINPSKNRSSSARWYNKMKEGYSADPTKNTVARLKWLIDKEGIQTTRDGSKALRG